MNRGDSKPCGPHGLHLAHEGPATSDSACGAWTLGGMWTGCAWIEPWNVCRQRAKAWVRTVARHAVAGAAP